MSGSEILVTGYVRRERALVLKLLSQSFYVHHHLDWEPLPKWLSDPNNRLALAWEADYLCGAMAFSPPHQRTSWLRLLLLPLTNTEQVFLALWAYLRNILQPETDQLAIMPHDSWLMPYLEKIGFQQYERIVHLERTAQPLPPLANNPSRLQIRRLRWGEFWQVLRVDHAAFERLWQMRAGELREAGRHAHHYTLAHNGQGIIGYQLSMLYGHSMHLSRIATLPAYQNQQIASRLLADMLQQADKVGATTVTVNTQASNYQSRRLYERFGFQYEAREMLVYTLNWA